MENYNVFQVKKVLLVTSSTTPGIYICSFIKIDRKLIVNLLSAIMTYLFVLMQFQISTNINFTSKSSNNNFRNNYSTTA